MKKLFALLPLTLLAVLPFLVKQRIQGATNPAASFPTSEQALTQNMPEWANRIIDELNARVKQAEENLGNYNQLHLLYIPTNLMTNQLLHFVEQHLRSETNVVIKQLLYEEMRSGRLTQLPESFFDTQPTYNKLPEERLKVEYEDKIRYSQILQKIIKEYRSRSFKRSQELMEYQILKQKVETAKTLYAEFLMKLRQSGIATDQKDKRKPYATVING